MKKIATNLQDCYIIEPNRFGDARGYFSPYFIQKDFEELGLKKVVQTNRSMSSKGVLRGLHFQKNPKCQAKIVEVIKGRAIDVVVDMRIDSPTYGKYTTVLLTEDNNRQLFVPKGFAHGFLALEDDTVFQYIVDNDYAPKLEAGILWNDPDININWDELFKTYDIQSPLLSPKDGLHPGIKDNKVIFKREQEKYLITGVKGQLGFDVKRTLLNRGIKPENILAVDVDEMDITNKEEVMKTVKGFAPDVIFHCAAYTAVDKAEEDELTATAVNVTGTRNLTEASLAVGAKIVYVSTDYVFDGKKDGLYTPEDRVNPQSAYGMTKYLGEHEVKKNPRHFIARTSWVFGINGNNFVKTMLKLAENHRELNVVCDQVGSPTYTIDLANTLVDLAETDAYGTFHTTNEEYCSWAEFADYIFKVNHKDVKVNYVTTEEYARILGRKQAYRPLNSRLDKAKLSETGLDRMPTWQDATKRYSAELALIRELKGKVD